MELVTAWKPLVALHAKPLGPLEKDSIGLAQGASDSNNWLLQGQKCLPFGLCFLVEFIVLSFLAMSQQADAAESDDTSTGLTQRTAGMQIESPTVPAPGLAAPMLDAAARRTLPDFIDAAVLTNFHMIRASIAAGAPQSLMVPTQIDDYQELLAILRSLAFSIDATDEWHALSLHPLEGLEISLQTIEARLRLAQVIGSAAEDDLWVESDRAQAQAVISKLEHAAAACLKSFDDWRKQRRRLRTSKLSLWKELGTCAMKAL